MEIQEAQSIYEAKTRQLGSEKHLLQLSKREIGQLKNDLISLDRDLADAVKQLKELEAADAKGQLQVEVLKKELQITKAEWSNWQKAHQDKEEDHLALEKYTMDDARRITDLTIKVQRLTHDIAKRKQLLNQQMTISQLNKIELENTTETYKTLNKERQELLTKWETTVQMVSKRDSDVEAAKEHQIQLEMEVVEMEAEKRLKSEQHEEIEEEIAEIDKTIANLERTVATNIKSFNEKTQQFNEFKADISTMRATLTKMEVNLKNTKTSNNELDQDLKLKIEEVEKQRNRKVAAEAKLAEISSATLSIQEQNIQLEKLLETEETKRKMLERQLKEARENTQKQEKSIHDLKIDEKQINNLIRSSEAQLRSLKSSSAKLEEQAINREVLLYNHSFEVQQMERKIRRAQGERSKEETNALKDQIAKLEDELNSWNRKISTLLLENRHTSQDLTRSKKALERLLAERDKLEARMNELSTQVETATVQLNSRVSEKEEAIVEESLLKLDLKKLKINFDDRSDTLLTVEARQEQLQLFIEERIREIEAHKDVLRMSIKLAEEERFSSASKLRETITKVEKIKGKYEVIMMNLQTGDDEPEEVSQVFYIMKSAVRKEELRKESHDLGEKVRIAEAEVKALEETLEIMMQQNNELRTLLKNEKLKVQDLEDKKILEEKIKTLMVEFKEKKRQLGIVETEIKQVQEKIAEEESKASQQNETLGSIEVEIKKIENDLKSQLDKIERAESQCEKIQKDWRSQNGANELDIQLKEIKEENRQLYNNLKAAAENDPEAHRIFESFCHTNGITPPSRAPSTTGSVNGDSRSQSRMSIAKSSTAKPKIAKTITIGTGLDEALNFSGKGKPSMWGAKPVVPAVRPQPANSSKSKSAEKGK